MTIAQLLASGQPVAAAAAGFLLSPAGDILNTLK